MTGVLAIPVFVITVPVTIRTRNKNSGRCSINSLKSDWKPQLYIKEEMMESASRLQLDRQEDTNGPFRVEMLPLRTYYLHIKHVQRKMGVPDE